MLNAFKIRRNGRYSLIMSIFWIFRPSMVRFFWKNIFSIFFSKVSPRFFSISCQKGEKILVLFRFLVIWLRNDVLSPISLFTVIGSSRDSYCEVGTSVFWRILHCSEICFDRHLENSRDTWRKKNKVRKWKWSKKHRIFVNVKLNKWISTDWNVSRLNIKGEKKKNIKKTHSMWTQCVLYLSASEAMSATKLSHWVIFVFIRGFLLKQVHPFIFSYEIGVQIGLFK